MWSDCGDCGSWDWVPVDLGEVLAKVEKEADRQFLLTEAKNHDVLGFVCRSCGAYAFRVAYPSYVGKPPRGGARQRGRKR